MRNRFSDFWLSDKTTDKLDKGEELSPIELAQAKRSIAEFVRIMTRKDIPVEFMEEGEQSYTDGDTVTIGANVGEEGFDATVGVALHEASHICRSDFDMLDEFQEADEEGRAPDFVPQEFIDKIEPLLEKSDKYKEIEKELKSANPDYDESELDPENQATRALHHLWNVVEDRWIDQWAYSEAPGYRGYYQKMYKRFWNSEEIAEKLQGDEGRDLDWSSYSFRITNITNDASDLDALPGLRKIWNILDVANIERHETSWDCLETAKEIMRVVLENAESLYVDPAFGAGGGEDGEGTPYEDLPDDLQEMLEDQLDQMQGEAGEELDGETADKVDTLEDAGVDTENVGEGIDDSPYSSDKMSDTNSAEASGVPCVVIESISEGMVEKSNFPIIGSKTNRRSKEAVMRGFKKGRILGNRLKLRDERRSTKHPRKRSGKLDGRILAEINHSSNLFYTEEIEQYKDGFIHISVDASGSMSGDKFKDAMQTCVTIAKAADMIENIRAQVSFRSRVRVGSNTQPLIVLAYDSQREPIENIKRYFPHISAGGTTPEGLTFEAIQDKVLPANSNRECYFVNLSDGKPHFSGGSDSNSINYSGDQALNHTAQEIRKMRRKGVKILSYYIGGNNRDRDFKQMYGDAARYIDVNDITRIRKTLNEKFLEDDGKKVST
jgi:hypothetical protein